VGWWMEKRQGFFWGEGVSFKSKNVVGKEPVSDDNLGNVAKSSSLLGRFFPQNFSALNVRKKQKLESMRIFLF